MIVPKRFVQDSRETKPASGKIAFTLSLPTAGKIASPYARGSISELLTQKRIFWFFMPLALSWIFMSLESPIVAGIISRRGGAELALAGLALLWPISILIEAPVIDLLSTSTTLAKSHQNYVQIRKFAVMLMVWVTLAHAAVAASPFYWILIERWIGADHEVAVVLRTPMLILIPWAAFVGWRRYLHGVLIRFDNTRPVGMGTFIRVVTVVVVGIGVFLSTLLPGLTIAAIALLSSVAAETVFIHFVSRPIIRKHLDPTKGQPDGDLSLRKLSEFHFPLTAASATMILSMPLVSWALASSPNGTLMLAAYGIAMGIIFTFRSVTFALPETVIALYKNEQSRDALAKFCRNVGLICSGALLLAYFTGASDLLFLRVLNAEPDVAKLASLALLATLALPALNGIAAHKRGVLTFHHLTKPRLVAIVIAVGALFSTLLIGVSLNLNGILVAGAAMTVQHIAELSVLSVLWKRNQSTISDVS
ncbi:MAG: hypothetical protein IH944_11905 [Armatimonadetes bacterium]|nr:hypothetical protein [Armatimonadota bacterium]